MSEQVFYHAFEMGSTNTGPGSWLVDSESVATPEEPPSPFADLAARSDGSLVAVYGGSRRLFLQIRSAQGIWADPIEIDSNIVPDLSGPVLVTGIDNVVTLAYTGRDGSGFVRHLCPDGSLFPRVVISDNLGSDDEKNGAILPLVAFPESATTAMSYREQDGTLYERRFYRDGSLSPPVKVSNLVVVTSAADSDQAGADLIRHGSTLHLLFIEAEFRSLFYARSDRPGTWSEPQPVTEHIEGAWVRGSVHVDASGNSVYGFVYDAGSRGGSGFCAFSSSPGKIIGASQPPYVTSG